VTVDTLGEVRIVKADVCSRTGNLNYAAPEGRDMTRELEHECPECDAEQPFYPAASTELHLGEKTKWYCTECDFGLIRIDGEVDSTTA
jgi:hypothetical protein